MSREYPSGKVTYNGRTRLIKTWFEFPPIPIRSCDYGATFEDWDLGDPNPCFASTPEEAIDQLLDQIDTDYDYTYEPTAIAGRNYQSK